MGSNVKGNAASGKTANRLTFEQRIKLYEWLKKNAEEVRDRRPTYEKLAAELTSELGFRLLASNIASTTKEAGVTWVPRQRKRRVKVETKASFADGVLARAVADLYRQLGLALPTAIEALIAATEPQPQASETLPAPKGQTVPVSELSPAVARLHLNSNGATVAR